MNNTEKNNKINIKMTVEHAVANYKNEFHFFVDELNSSNYMPTYAGEADEKYEFKEMSEDFFKFLHQKSVENGIFIRLVYATLINSCDEAVFKLEYGCCEEIFKTNDFDNISEFEYADYGVKIKGDEITFGATVEKNCFQTPYFAKFDSKKDNEKFLSLKNPLNQRIIEIMENMIL